MAAPTMQQITLRLLLLLLISIAPLVTQAGQSLSQLRVAYEPDLVPQNFLSETTAQGFAVELLEAIAGWHNFELLYLPMTKREAIERMARQEIDIILSTPFSRIQSEMMEFTDPYYSASIGILARGRSAGDASVTELAESLVALQNMTVEYEFLKNIRRIRYQVAHSQRAALELFVAGRADYFIGNTTTARHYLEAHGLQHQYHFAHTYLMPVDYSFAVQKENYVLLNILNSGIRQLKSSGAHSDLHRKWFGYQEHVSSGMLLLILKIGFWVLVGFLVIVLLGARWNRQLKREVERKTRDLSHVNASLRDQITLTQNNSEFLKQIIDSSPRGIVTLDKASRITKINHRAMKILGLETPPLGRRYDEIPLLGELLAGKAEPVLVGTRASFLGEYKEWHGAAPRPYQLRYYVYPLYQFNQEINGLILTFEDVTEEFELRRKLFEQEKSRALIRVVAGIAHEIRNPLSSIKTFVELIPRKIHSEKFQREISTYVPREIVRINELIEGLINYARPRQITLERVEVKTLLEECAILFERSILNKGFQLTYTAPEALCILVDHHQIKQVIINFLINALDALEEKSHDGARALSIDLRAFTVGKRVCIQVADNGVGMNEEGKVKMLEPFFTTKPKGTGLGLPIADQLIRENNGELKIESQQGVGTVISVFFDLAAKE